MHKQFLLRLYKLFVIIGFPALGFLYAYQFIGQDRETIVPFKTFKAPITNVASLGRSELHSLKFNAPVTIVSFWATWCPPCVEEFPAMIELQRQLEGTGVEIAFISVDDNWAAIDRFVKQYDLQINPERIYLDANKQAANAWGSDKFPETYVVRRDGWVVEKIIGAQQWTRPAVIEYFTNLGAKFHSLQASNGHWLNLVLGNEAWAQSGQMLHEDDRKNLEKLRANIETASKNQRNVEAALKEERRNLEEQRLATERKQKDEQEASGEVDKLKSKRKDVKTVLEKNTDSQKAEKSEKGRDEDRIKKIQKRIKELQSEIDEEKSKLLQANKDLNTRTQQIETFEEARKSSQDELEELEKRVKYAEKIYKERGSVTESARSEQRARERKVKDLERAVDKAKGVLDEQKAKLADFEKMLSR